MTQSMQATTAAACATAILAIVACSPAQSEPIVYHANYVEYGSVQEITGAADIVLVGTVLSSDVRTVDLLVESDGGDDPDRNPEYGAEGEGLGGEFVLTVYQVFVEEVIAGDAAVGDTIEVAQLGGNLDGQEYREAGTDYLTSDDTFALFLADFDDVPAQPLNNTQAIYAKQDDSSFQSLSSENSIAGAVEAVLDDS